MKIEIGTELQKIKEAMCRRKTLQENPLVWEPFLKDLRLRLSWNSNSLEGNTLSLDETVALIEYDEVRAGHTYTEYQEAKSMYQAVDQMLDFRNAKPLGIEWIKEANGMILQDEGKFRVKNVYIGTLSEAIYYPPDYEKVERLMEDFAAGLESYPGEEIEDVITHVAQKHIVFERIHPFLDGNGRTGRLLMSQQLLNCGMLPAIIKDQSKYRQAFRRYDRTGELSLMKYVIAGGIVETYEKLLAVEQKYREALGEPVNEPDLKSRKAPSNQEMKSPRL